MGISVQELLASEFFRDFEVIAGRKGLNKEIQGLTILEAPDGFKWAKGKEMIMSSGYVMMQEPDCVRKAFEEGSIQKASALMIKLGRYLGRIPDEIVALCNENEMPLILAPFAVPWMEIISQTNVAVMNRTISRFRVPDSGGRLVTNQSYKEQKIHRILQAVESEMKFPASVYDLSEEKSYYSSSNFTRMTEYFGMNETDYWDPSVPYTHHTLCDYIKMSRYRLFDPENPDGPRVSWIVIPIRLNGVTHAYFTVMEAQSLMDYYDEISIRIAYLILQSLYEQISGAREAGFMGFENFIHFAMSCGDEDASRVISQAGIQGISMSIPYDYALLRMEGSGANEAREKIMNCFARSSFFRCAKLAILDDRDILLLIEPAEQGKRTAAETSNGVAELITALKENLPGTRFSAGISRDGKTLRDIKDSVSKCRRLIEMGRVLQPQRNIWDYEDIGPLTWLSIPDGELAGLMNRYNGIFDGEKGQELLRTLRLYLENNMNYSVVSDLMYIHINTVRKRIDKLNDLLGTDWSDPVEKVNTILILQLLEAASK